MGGVYRLRGPASNWSGWYGDESVGWVVFSIFFSFFLFSTKLETSFRGNEGKIGRRDGDRRERRVVGKVVSTWINAFSEFLWHFGIYFPYYGDGWGSIVGSLDNCMQFAPDFLSSARYTSRMGWVKADTSVHSFHLSLLLRRGSRFFSKEVSISFKWWHVKDRFCTG